MVSATSQTPFLIPGDPPIHGWTSGEGRDLVLCHGLSATGDFVLHGSTYLARNGFQVHAWDARGHGASGPAPENEDYDYRHQVEDLDRVIEACTGGRDLLLVGHSMGAHTALAWTLLNPSRVLGLALIGPVYTEGRELTVDDRWNKRAAALEEGGPEEFSKLAGEEFEGGGEDRETVERIALERTRRHQYPGAVARALREVPRSRPVNGLGLLEGLEVPTLVIGSRDTYDPGHPLAVARRYAELLPNSEFIVEGPDERPLAWQGGRLSRILARFFGSLVSTGGR